MHDPPGGDYRKASETVRENEREAERVRESERDGIVHSESESRPNLLAGFEALVPAHKQPYFHYIR